MRVKRWFLPASSVMAVALSCSISVHLQKSEQSSFQLSKVTPSADSINGRTGGTKFDT